MYELWAILGRKKCFSNIADPPFVINNNSYYI